MTTSRVGGNSIDITLGTQIIHVKTVSVDISDNTAVSQTRGIPDGYVSGDVSAEGEFEVDTKNFKKLGAAAREAGGYRAIPTTDILFYANTGDEELTVEVFGCKLIITSPLGFDPKGGETATHKFKYIVTSPDFVRIDGTPILSSADVRDLIG
ncbi:phage protein [Yersinia pekkanenii]|uniref:Tail tube protein n=1 Tax=Yersinia pekkanenii TaxID=1288385 RepID=A0A0T9QHE3_9GAMM|nr:phage protein [Yersinia pekkanenii]CNI11486.1 putative tail tube protein [Yersinia pekkanenii]CRY69233.1 putative tail tube protein [Yersinia pekkanenii]